MKKQCPGCSQTLKMTDFAFKNKAKGTLQPYCNPCRRDRAKAAYPKYRKAIIKAVVGRQKLVRDKYYDFKKSQHCLTCGETESACLVFHHTDPAKKDLEVSSLVNHAWSRIMKEIDKCVCLCANCHAKIHAGIISLPL